MEFGAAEREDCEMDCEMDGGNASDSSSASNPRHPWNVVSAPAMAHQSKFDVSHFRSFYLFR